MYIYIYIYRDSLVKSPQWEPSIPQQLNTDVIRGACETCTTSVKRAQLLANVDNFYEFDDKFSNTAKSSESDYISIYLYIYMWVCLKIGYPKRQWFILVRHQFLLNNCHLMLIQKGFPSHPDISSINIFTIFRYQNLSLPSHPPKKCPSSTSALAKFWMMPRDSRSWRLGSNLGFHPVPGGFFQWNIWENPQPTWRFSMGKYHGENRL